MKSKNNLVKIKYPIISNVKPVFSCKFKFVPNVS